MPPRKGQKPATTPAPAPVQNPSVPPPKGGNVSVPLKKDAQPGKGGNGNGGKGKTKPSAVPAKSDVVYPNLKIGLHLATNTPEKMEKAQEALQLLRDTTGLEVSLEPPITAQFMKELIGWQSQTDFVMELTEGQPEEQRQQALANAHKQFGDNYDLVDWTGDKVRCSHNAHNRPFTPEDSYRYAQDILSRRWADSRNGEDMSINGETLVVGNKGNVISGQHRAFGLIFAYQQWAGLNKEKDGSEHWKKIWEEEPSIEGIIVYGVSENKAVVRTLDNVKTRTLTDVLYTDDMFRGQDISSDARRTLCRMLEHSVQFMWQRTKAKEDPYAPRQTHSEALDFIDRHPRLKQCVRFVWEINRPEEIQDGEGKTKKGVTPLTSFVPPGRAAAMLYLMGACVTDGEDQYKNGEVPRTEVKDGVYYVDWEYWDKACQFWKDLCSPMKERPEWVDNLLACKRPTTEEEGEGAGYVFSPGEGGGSIKERTAALVRAWNLYRDDEEITSENVCPAEGYKVDTVRNQKAVVLAMHPDVGGIDWGEEVKKPKEKTAKEGDTTATEGGNNVGVEGGETSAEDVDMADMDTGEEFDPDYVGEETQG